MNIAVVGLGKTGLAIACGLVRKGHKVLGVELSEKRRGEIKEEGRTFEEPGCGWEVRANLDVVAPGSFLVGEADLVLLMVNTPEVPGAPGVIDLRAIKSASSDIALYSGLVVVSSTVLPGTCRAILRPLLHPRATLVFNPVWLALGTVIQDYLNPPVVVLGHDGVLVGEDLKKFWEIFGEKRNYIYTDLTTAEAVKIMYNVWCTLKMAFANETASIFEELGADSAVMEGFMKLGGERVGKFLKPGPPFGGPCFPRDLRFAEQVAGGNEELIRAVARVNANGYNKIVEEVRKKNGVRTVGIVGLSYKEGVPVLEESSSIILADLLRDREYKVVGYDSLVKEGVDGVEVVGDLKEIEERSDVIIEMHKGLVDTRVERYKKVIRPWG